MQSLPANAATVEQPCVMISADLLAFCIYAETQLTSTADAEVGNLLYSLFWRLIGRQDFASRIDPRIMRAVSMMCT